MSFSSSTNNFCPDSSPCPAPEASNARRACSRSTGSAPLASSSRRTCLSSQQAPRSLSKSAASSSFAPAPNDDCLSRPPPAAAPLLEHASPIPRASCSSGPRPPASARMRVMPNSSSGSTLSACFASSELTCGSVASPSSPCKRYVTTIGGPKLSGFPPPLRVEDAAAAAAAAAAAPPPQTPPLDARADDERMGEADTVPAARAGFHTCSYTSWIGRSRFTMRPATRSSIPKSSSHKPCISSVEQMKFFRLRMVNPASEERYGLRCIDPRMYSSCDGALCRCSNTTGIGLTGHTSAHSCLMMRVKDCTGGASRCDVVVKVRSMNRTHAKMVCAFNRSL
mmetsp:Transcript_870/g.3217  ORF Transcript_870/g.3217 Transcript_870/m.3217 type:complete len:338 (-) Transcript_870:60-1073(-)